VTRSSAGTTALRTAKSASALAITLGLGDVATGVSLLIGPRWVPSILGIAAPPEGADVFLRWIGIFVAAVGSAYLDPWRTPAGALRRARLRAVLQWTAGVRLAVAGFVALAVLGGALPDGWCLVGAYDAVAATLQLTLVAVGALGDTVGDDG
jgi:hypothetical protein